MSEGYDIYAEFLKSLVEAEASRKTSLEQRGIAVITTSGAFVTFLYALATVVTNSRTLKLPAASDGLLIASSVLFVLAAITGIVVNAPLFYGEENLTKETLRSYWKNSASDAQAAVTAVRLDRLQVARQSNGFKAWTLVVSITFEVAAVAILSVALFTSLK